MDTVWYHQGKLTTRLCKRGIPDSKVHGSRWHARIRGNLNNAICSERASVSGVSATYLMFAADSVGSHSAEEGPPIDTSG